MNEERERLFKNSKPFVRLIEEKDFRWLWASYKENGGEATQDEFLEIATNYLSYFDEAFVIEDDNKAFKDGRGVVCVVLCFFKDGWRLEPHIEWFSWATKKNRLRGVVSFLMFTRYSKNIGITLVHCEEKLKSFFKKIRKYVPIYGGYRIPGGRPDGEDNIFYVRGRKKWDS